jgi:hypothetical protein
MDSVCAHDGLLGEGGCEKDCKKAFRPSGSYMFLVQLQLVKWDRGECPMALFRDKSDAEDFLFSMDSEKWCGDITRVVMLEKQR